MGATRELFHAYCARINRSIAGDVDAAKRYREAGDEQRALESEASADRWRNIIRQRLNGGRAS